MPTTITTNRITSLTTELTNLAGFTRTEAEERIKRSLTEGLLIFTVPFNDTSMPLSVNASASSKAVTPVSTTRTTAGTTTLGTVPANKVWRILTAWVTGTNVATSQDDIACRIQANSLTIVATSFCGTATMNAGLATSNSCSWNYSACPTLTAGQTATLITDHAGYGEGGITYVEEDA